MSQIDQFVPKDSSGHQTAMSKYPHLVPFSQGGRDNYDAGYDEVEGGAFDFWEALQTVLIRKYLISAIILLALAAAALITIKSTPLYRAEATIEVQKSESQIIEGASVEPLVIADAEYMATQYALLQSRSLAQRVVEVLGLHGDPDYADQEMDRTIRIRQATDKIIDNLSVEPVGRSRIIGVRYVSDDPREAAMVPNTIVENFIASSLERKYNNTAYARNFLQERLVATKAALEDSERRLVKYAAAKNILDLDESGGSLDGNSLVALNKQLAVIQSQRIEAEQRYLEARDNPDTLQLLESIDLQRLRATKSELVGEYQERLGEFKPDYPSMIQLQSRIDAIDEEIASERQTIILGLKGVYQATKATEDTLKARVNELRNDVQDLRNRRIEYGILQREVDTNRSQYEALLQRLKAVGISGSVSSSNISLVDSAQIPNIPFSPNITKNLLQAFVLSLIVGVGMAYALAYVDDTIKSPDDVRSKLGLPPMGVIPKAEEEGTIVKALEDPRSGISEGFFSARTALQFSSPAGTPRSLLVTSTQPGEGKSSTSVSLATVIAKTGQRALIIDADMRKPSFQTDGSKSIGLSGLLTRDERLEDHIIYSQPTLALLPSGVIPPNPAEILSSPRLREIIRQAEEMFDVVIVDSPPVLSFTDAPTLGAVCEACIVAIQAGQIRRPAAQRTVVRLLESRTNVIGAILTKFDVKKAGYNYGYYHYAYGKSAYAYGNEALSKSSREKRKINLFSPDEPADDMNDEDEKIA